MPAVSMASARYPPTTVISLTLSFLKLSINQRSSGLPAIGSMTFGRSVVTASRPLPRLAANTTAEREAPEAERYRRSAAEYSSAS